MYVCVLSVFALSCIGTAFWLADPPQSKESYYLSLKKKEVSLDAWNYGGGINLSTSTEQTESQNCDDDDDDDVWCMKEYHIWQCKHMTGRNIKITCQDRSKIWDTLHVVLSSVAKHELKTLLIITCSFILLIHIWK